ncbi:MAG: NAD(+)/NADH kinase [Deltaproteobacteria bacterium]|nr:NAD(+)/NADH kinase [Deltaproteobacteria bacterium]MBW1818015.1 NAD(+)/NADH kinase [Deltaproteobacteria bacterium]
MPSAMVGIIYKRHHKPARLEAEKLSAWFEKRNIRVFSEEMMAAETVQGCEDGASIIPTNVNWVVVLGGDGTLLAAARRVGRFGAPILGVNLGGLGFLTGIPLGRLYPVIEMMIDDRLVTECHGMLETQVIRNAETMCRFPVLNDVVINKGTLARIIDLNVTINDEFLTTFRADGLIIATPTGSTAYNLSAGGPVLYPTMEATILTPICPFTLANRPIIIPDSHRIQLAMGKESEEAVLLTFDGQVGFNLDYGDRVHIHKSKEKIRLLRPPDHNYFRVLRDKLLWGGGPRNS